MPQTHTPLPLGPCAIMVPHQRGAYAHYGDVPQSERDDMHTVYYVATVEEAIELRDAIRTGHAHQRAAIAALLTEIIERSK